MRNRRKTPIEERYWAKVTKGGPFDCWGWSGATAHGGYGVLGAGRRGEGLIRAHRLAWELQYGPIPDGMIVLHICDNPPCTNTLHLQLGTMQENTADMIRKGRARFDVALRGSETKQAILTETEVLEIFSYPRYRGSATFLAKKFGVVPTAISNIRTGRTWGWLTQGMRHPDASIADITVSESEKRN